jgi:hypothetical protein
METPNQALAAIMIAVIPTVIGGIFGFILSELSATRREMREERKRAESVRTILSIEIERNLSMIRDFREKIMVNMSGDDERDERTKRDLARRFVDVPLLGIRRAALDAQMPLLSSALNRTDIIEVFQFYERVSHLDTMRRELSHALTDQQHEQSNFQKSLNTPMQQGGVPYSPRRPFDNKAVELWDDIEATMDALLNKGNPI